MRFLEIPISLVRYPTEEMEPVYKYLLEQGSDSYKQRSFLINPVWII